MIKRYWIASITGKRKFLVRALHDPTENALIIPKEKGIRLISNAKGFYDRNAMLKELKMAGEAGMITLVETRDEKLLKHSPIINLAETGKDQRPLRDRDYERFKSMFEAGEIDVPKQHRTQIEAALNGGVREEISPVSGKTDYDFRKAENTELTALLVLTAAHTDPPKDLNYFLQVEQTIAEESKTLSKTERMKQSINNMDKIWSEKMEERIQKAGKNFGE